MSDDAPKLRLKPRLSPDTPAAPPLAESALPGEPAPKPRIMLRPRVDAGAVPPAPPPVAVVAVTSPAPTAAAPLTVPPVLPPLPSAPNANSAIGVVATSATATEPAAVSAEATRQVQRAALIIAAAGVVIFGAIGAIAYPRVMAQAKAFAAAELTVPEEEESEEAEYAEPLEATEASLAAETLPATSSLSTPTAPAPAHSNQNRPTANEAPADLQTWASQLKINGVRGGAVPRVLIDGRSYRKGEVVNVELGIVFDSYDARRRLLRFKDAAGNVVERRDR